MKIRNILIFGMFTLIMINANSAIIMQPYLMGVQKNSVWVLVECNTIDTVIVNFGLTPAYGNTAKTSSISITTENTYVHKVQLTGLIENTVYYYSARQLNSTSSGYSFITACNDQTNFRFVWIGDCRTGTAIHDQITALIPAYNPRFYLNGGDIANDSNYSTFKYEFFRQGTLDIISRVPFFLAPGNHEGWGTNSKAFTKGITVQSGTEDYYSFDYGNLHVLVINNYVNHSIGSNQYNFAMADLSSSTKTWKIVISHIPAYCAGGHGEDSTMKVMVTNIFEPTGVDMVISGHSHFYQHNFLNNIHHMILGGGGAPLHTPSNLYYTVKSVQDYNFGIIDVASNFLNLKVYNNLNILIDSVMLTKIPTFVNKNESIVKGFKLEDIYPNPSNPEFNISFEINKEGIYKLELFDNTGRNIALIMHERLYPGKYEITYNTTSLPSSIYYIMLSDNRGEFQSKKIAIIK
ncbi:MAG: metallophosphoesterase [Ignavibacteria bacterium]|nr:metallophosphoesterase [Ignavibacteria bacterium]